MKKIFLLCILSLCLLGITSCGKEKAVKDPVSQEAELGIKLENQAQDAVDTYQDQAGDADSMLDNPEAIGD